MGQYLKPNRDAKIKKKNKTSKRFDDDYDFQIPKGKKKYKPNLKRMRDPEGFE